MYVTITHLNSYRGPHIFGPQPGVRLRLQTASDCSVRLRAALKDGAQFVGLMLAQLQCLAQPNSTGWQIEAHFVTDAPDLAAALCRYVVAGMQAEFADDQEWDRDTPLFDLQTQRRQQALPPALLQLVAEAHHRELPVLQRADGQIQLGHGPSGVRLDPQMLRRHPAPTFDWTHLQRKTIIAVTGAAQAELVAQLASNWPAAHHVTNADYATSVALLADHPTEQIILGLQIADLLAYGAGFDQCTQAWVGHLGTTVPISAVESDEWIRAAGLPMLLSREPVRLDLRDARLSVLVPYAPYGVLPC